MLMLISASIYVLCLTNDLVYARISQKFLTCQYCTKKENYLAYWNHCFRSILARVLIEQRHSVVLTNYSHPIFKCRMLSKNCFYYSSCFTAQFTVDYITIHGNLSLIPIFHRIALERDMILGIRSLDVIYILHFFYKKNVYKKIGLRRPRPF